MRNDIFLKEVGRKIVVRRKELKISQQELADLCQISRSGLSYIENGLQSPNLMMLSNIADKLNLNIKDLL